MKQYIFVLVLLVMMAFFWILLNEALSFHALGVGFMIGVPTLFLVQIYVLETEGKDFDFRTLLNCAIIIIKTILSIIPSSLTVIKAILSDKMFISRVAVELPSNDHFINALLCNLITLTPGTITLEINQDRAEIIVLNPRNVPEKDLSLEIQQMWKGIKR